MEKGKRTVPSRSLDEIKHYVLKRLGQLPPEYKRFDNPHEYKVGLSYELKKERDQLRSQHQ